MINLNCMNTPELSRILRSARQIGLCVPAVEKLEEFLRSSEDGRVSRLEELSQKSGSIIELSDNIGREFMTHLVTERFQMVTC